MKIAKIFVDMDGVLADFNGSFDILNGLKGQTAREYELTHGTVALWEKIYSVPNFFLDMRPFDHTTDLWSLCSFVSDQVVVLSTPSRTNSPICMLQKRQWLDKHIGKDVGAIFDAAKYRYAEFARILIDDSPKKIKAWEEAGGIGHLFTDYDSCLLFLLQFEWSDMRALQ